MGRPRRRLRAVAPAEVSDFTVRPARDGDGKALTELAAAAADTGAVRIAPHYLHDPLETSRVLRPDASHPSITLSKVDSKSSRERLVMPPQVRRTRPSANGGRT